MQSDSARHLRYRHLQLSFPAVVWDGQTREQPHVLVSSAFISLSRVSHVVSSRLSAGTGNLHNLTQRRFIFCSLYLSHTGQQGGLLPISLRN